MALAACGGSDSTATTTTAQDQDSGTTTTTAQGQDSGTTTTSAAPTTTAAPQPPTDGPSGGQGSATLIVGSETYEFDNFYCFMGSDNTGNSRVSFSSGAFGTVDGKRAQLDASIQDVDELDRMDGEGTLHLVSLNDIEDFENQSVAWDAATGFIGAPEWTVVYDGSTVSVDAVFDDMRTDDQEEIPGTLRATCP